MTMLNGIDARRSVFVNGEWLDAEWRVETLDGETGEMVITATVMGPGAPVVTALRMSMELAARLREAAGFEGALEAEPCYDCRTTTERLEALERRVKADADALAVQYARVLENLSTLATRQTLLEERVDGLSSWLGKVTRETARDAVGEWSDELTSHWQRIEALTSRLNEMEERTDTLSGVVRLTRAVEVAGLRSRLEGVADDAAIRRAAARGQAMNEYYDPENDSARVSQWDLFLLTMVQDIERRLAALAGVHDA